MTGKSGLTLGDVRLGDRLRRLDDNAGSPTMVRLSDSFGWLSNLGVGALLLVAGLVLLLSGGARDDTVACLAFGSAGVLVGCPADRSATAAQKDSDTHSPFSRT